MPFEASAACPPCLSFQHGRSLSHIRPPKLSQRPIRSFVHVLPGIWSDTILISRLDLALSKTKGRRDEKTWKGRKEAEREGEEREREVGNGTWKGSCSESLTGTFPTPWPASPCPPQSTFQSKTSATTPPLRMPPGWLSGTSGTSEGLVPLPAHVASTPVPLVIGFAHDFAPGAIPRTSPKAPHTQPGLQLHTNIRSPPLPSFPSPSCVCTTTALPTKISPRDLQLLVCPPNSNPGDYR